MATNRELAEKIATDLDDYHFLGDGPGGCSYKDTDVLPRILAILDRDRPEGREDPFPSCCRNVIATGVTITSDCDLTGFHLCTCAAHRCETPGACKGGCGCATCREAK